ncbi:MAG: bacillithiol system redox-active protein YtxJ [Flavobacterium sp.]|uniref:bacillithiol system redox-active protein YtxJ n=1 Tax=Flavobacterium sp. TaxID=239 RepID=UPI0032634D36
MFGNTEEKNNHSTIKWNTLSDLGELNEIVNVSHDKPVVIFKHSTRCSVSRMVLKQFESEFDSQDKIIPYFLDLIEFRNVSNEIANRFNVVHQSPQIILIKDGKSIYNASHSDIDANDLEEKLT